MKYKLLAVLASALCWGSCNILDEYPQTGPSSENFFSSEAELTLAINAAYSTFHWLTNQDVQYPAPFSTVLRKWSIFAEPMLT